MFGHVDNVVQIDEWIIDGFHINTFQNAGSEYQFTDSTVTWLKKKKNKFY